MSDTPIGCGPEGTVSKYADIVNTLETMAGSYAYAVRKGELREAARTIMAMDRENAALREFAERILANARTLAEDREQGDASRRTWRICADDAEATLNPQSSQGHSVPESEPLPEDQMCPNCVTPWKCNGPHIPPHMEGGGQ